MEIEELLRNSFKKYPSVSSLITAKDIKKWKSLSNEYNDFLEDYVYKVNFNILTTLIAANFNIVAAINLLQFFEDSLKIFPELLQSNEFKRNIKSLTDFGFFSFLSELSVAKRYKSMGYKVRFNVKYAKLAKGKLKPKDVDIEATDKKGDRIYIDVYTPYKKTEIKGFSDLNANKDEFENLIDNKQFNKFHGLPSHQLIGKKLLEINCAYHDDYRISLALLGERYNIKGIVGIQMFHHDIARASRSHLMQYIPIHQLT